MGQENLQSLTSSETENKIKDSTSDIVKKSQEILSKLKEKFGEQSQEYQKVKKEYDDVQKSILESLKNDRKITQEELIFIELEFTNLLKMNVGDSAVSSVLNQTGKLARWLGADSSKVDFLGDSVKITNQYQEDLIKKILGADYDKGYNDKYLRGHNQSTGNFLVKIEDFEKDLKSLKIDTINSQILANYFTYIASKKEITQQVISEILTPEQYKHLIELWKNNPDSIAQKILSRNNVFHMDDVTGDFFKYYDGLDSKDMYGDIKKKPSKVYLITDQKVLLDCIKKINGIAYKNINSYMQLDIDVIVEISKKDPSFSINSIPQGFFEVSNNKYDIEKIKKLFLIGKNESDYLKIISELSVSLGDKMDSFMQYLIEDNGMQSYKSFFQSLGKYKQEMNSLTQENFNQAYENLLKSKNNQDLRIINLYLNKSGIQKIEEKIFLLLSKDGYSLEDFPAIQKNLYTNEAFAKKIILKFPKEFKNLSPTLQSNPNLVAIFLDTVMISNLPWSHIITYLEEIQFGKDISIVLVVYDRLKEKYGLEKTKNILRSEKISQKIQVFFKNLEGIEQSEGQKEALKNLSTVFSELISEFEQSKNTIIKIQEEYKKNTNLDTKEKDALLLEKIAKITGFNELQNKEIFDLIKKEPNEKNAKILYDIVKKFAGYKTEKIKDIFKKLQTIQLDVKKEEIVKQKEDIRAMGIDGDDIDRFLIDNGRQKNESEEDYKKRVFELYISQRGETFSLQQQEEIKRYIQSKNAIKNLEESIQNSDLYITYLENPEKFSSFQDYKEAKLPEGDIFSGDQMYGGFKQYTYPSGNILEFQEIGNGKYKIDGIEVLSTEFNIIKGNEKARENLVNFNQILQELNLEGLWKYRQPLFTAISSKYVGVFELENDYMNQREIKIFISSVLSSLGISLSPNTPIDEFKQKVKYINKVGVIGGQEEVNLRGEGYIENQFLDTFDPKRSGIIHPHTVQEKIGNLFGGNT